MSLWERIGPEFAAVRQRPAKTSIKARLRHLAGFKLSVLDFVIALGRKIGGFFALLSLGWLYFRLLVLGQTVAQVYPGAADPDLRQTLWVGVFLVMAQGWDIPTDHLIELWRRLRAHVRPAAGKGAPARPLLARNAWTRIEPVVAALGRFMDLCVAIANKVGAFAVFCYLIVLAEQLLWAGVTVREMYPKAADPTVSFLADLCVYIVVLGWWATPFEQIAFFWRRLSRRDTEL